MLNVFRYYSLSFETESLTGPRAYLLAGLAGQQALGIHLSPCPQIWITMVIGMYNSIQLLHEYQGSELRPSGLYGRCFAN